MGYTHSMPQDEGKNWQLHEKNTQLLGDVPTHLSLKLTYYSLKKERCLQD